MMQLTIADCGENEIASMPLAASSTVTPHAKARGERSARDVGIGVHGFTPPVPFPSPGSVR